MQKQNKYDFVGTATAYGIKCADGRTITHGAFDHQDGDRVPLVWRHLHNSIDNVLGHGILFATNVGMKIRAKFNDTPAGKKAKMLVDGGDITSLSVWANQVKETAGNVSHGVIREVSLVLSGANPGASIEEVFAHDGVMIEDSGVIIHSSIPIELYEEEVEEEEEIGDDAVKHEDKDSKTVKDILASMTEEQRGLVGALIKSAADGTKLSDSGGSDNGRSVSDILNSMSDEQKDVLYYLVGTVDSEKVEHESDEDNPMTYNVFEGDEGGTFLSHEEQGKILGDAIAQSASSLKQVIISHSVTDIDLMFPDAKPVDGSVPKIYGRDMAWVPKVVDRCRKTPFSRIRSFYTDLTPDEARARGYVTGNEKNEEIIQLFRRETYPQTIYKKQGLHRDDVLDITSFNFVAWLKTEMKMMLKEELARAVLVGDGRAAGHVDKIEPTKVRPVWTDADIYSHKVLLPVAATVLDFIDAVTTSHEFYMGSGSPTLYCTPAMLSAMLIVKDADNRRIYPRVSDLKEALLVDEIVTVPVMSGLERDGAVNVQALKAILVNLRDYAIGADNGGQTTFFEDFDIDFNKMKYLYETRVSGALVRPKAAIVFEQDTGNPI